MKFSDKIFFIFQSGVLETEKSVLGHTRPIYLHAQFLLPKCPLFFQTDVNA